MILCDFFRCIFLLDHHLQSLQLPITTTLHSLVFCGPLQSSFANY
jgi:hypothetical protein